MAHDVRDPRVDVRRRRVVSVPGTKTTWTPPAVVSVPGTKTTPSKRRSCAAAVVYGLTQMDRRTVRGLGELLRDPAPTRRRPLALVGRGVVVDAFARALLANGGDRRALAPLAAAGPEQLRGCVAVIACGQS